MLVYCSDVNKPKQNTCATISQIGVDTPIVAKSRIMPPPSSVFETSTVR